MHVNPSAIIIFKLVLAGLLGGVIGIEREIRRKPAGLRTSIFICMGSALFTILSDEVARRFGDPSPTRIVSNLIQGIGFLGAGAILRERGSVVGLTTAATIFVLAGVGMATGAGLYLIAAFTAFAVLLTLVMLGWIENRFNLKSRLMVFRLTTRSLEQTMARTQETLAALKVGMQHLQVFQIGGEFVMEFDADVSHSQQQEILSRMTAHATRCEVVPLDTAKE